jgi:hypothetical protein
MRAASAAVSTSDIDELEALGVARREVEIFEMIGLARIARVTDSELYEPDDAGGWAFITPVLTQHATGPESQRPEIFVRFGNIVDLVAWDPQEPRQWALRAGQTTWLGCVPPQYLDPEPVAVWRSILTWFRHGCAGVVPMSRDPVEIYRLIMEFPGGIIAEDELHAAELRRILERPWPLPAISFATEVRLAAR